MPLSRWDLFAENPDPESFGYNQQTPAGLTVLSPAQIVNVPQGILKKKK